MILPHGVGGGSASPQDSCLAPAFPTTAHYLYCAGKRVGTMVWGHSLLFYPLKFTGPATFIQKAFEMSSETNVFWGLLSEFWEGGFLKSWSRATHRGSCSWGSHWLWGQEQANHQRGVLSSSGLALTSQVWIHWMSLRNVCSSHVGVQPLVIAITLEQGKWQENASVPSSEMVTPVFLVKGADTTNFSESALFVSWDSW